MNRTCRGVVKRHPIFDTHGIAGYMMTRKWHRPFGATQILWLVNLPAVASLPFAETLDLDEVSKTHITDYPLRWECKKVASTKMVGANITAREFVIINEPATATTKGYAKNAYPLRSASYDHY